MAALLGLVLAHGGTAGLAVEIAVLVGIVALALSIWVGQRRKDDEGPD